MRYIERVLPSLGETAVALRSLGEVVDGVRATRHDEPAVADVKGSARMAELLRRTARQAVPGAPARVPGLLPRRRCSCSDRASSAAVRRQLLSQGRRNRQLPRVASTLLDAMWRQVRGERGRERGREDVRRRRCSATDAFVDFALAWWPPLDAADVLGWLRDPEFLARVGEGVLSRRGAAAARRSRGPASRPVGRGHRRCSTSCATRSATCPSSRAATATTTSTR